MKFSDPASSHRKFRSLLLAAISTLAAPVFGAPGDLDTTFLPGPNGPVASAVTQADGRILLAGSFTTVGGAIRRTAARVNANGSLDTGYDPEMTTNTTSTSINALMDGRAFFTGTFTTVNITTTLVSRKYAALFQSTGVVDTGFNPPTTLGTSNAETIVEAGNGMYLMGSSLGLHRLLSTGALDSGTGSFTHYTGGRVRSILVKPDSKILIGGPFFGASTAVTRKYLKQITSLGGLDNTFFSPVLNLEVNALAYQNDGKILVGGLFSTATNIDINPNPPPDTQPALLRLTSSGTFDPSFRPALGPAGCEVNSIAVQADGKILIGGNFTSVSSTVNSVTTTLSRRGIARINADGTVDPTFDAKINSGGYVVNSITLQADGKPIITGAFGAFDSAILSNIARLQNDAAISDLRAINSTTVRWMRGGSAPETQSVIFEYSTDNVNWIPVGFSGGVGTRITGGWELNGFTALPASCYLRARARTTGGTNNGSSGIVMATGTYPIQVLAVSPAGGSNIANGGSTALAPTGITTARSFPFLAKNIGTGDLYVYTATFSGPDASLFSVTANPTSPINGPAGSSPFTIQFAPTTLGPKTATLTITSNDPGVPTYTTTVTGEAVTDIEAWRHQYFGVTTSTGDAADNADPDNDGQSNLFEFVAGLIPNDRTSRFSQSVDTSANHAKVIFSPLVAGRSYDVETSTTLAAGSWTAATGTTTDNVNQRTFTDAATLESKRFYRIRITKP